MNSQRPLRVLVVSLFPLDEEGVGVLQGWFKFWFPRGYPVNVHRTAVALYTAEEWQRWTERMSFDWYLVTGVAAMQQINEYGGLPYGEFKTLVPHPQVSNSAVPLAHSAIRDLCRQLCDWNSKRPVPAEPQSEGTVISLFRSRSQV